MRLIDADEMAVQESEAYMKVNTREDVSPITQGINSVVHRKIQELIANTPTIDAVPVVRCRECKSWNEFMNGQNGKMFGDCKLVGTFRNEDDFCSYGERKDGEG